ncbi:MAG: LysR family transcriptional regulator [Rhodocyclaceae bacterium]|nr:LysR family transcriptional regulator [Rhodocyclaceae bacterium]MBX3669643.1 LysR family transcriptional regulator [Rhodocyclaceae bacterium]
MDRLEAMNLFVRVAEKGSFSAVADQMDLPRSVVTRKIAALEAHLGTKLIARSTRSLSLTSAGQNYLDKSREILALVDAAETGLDAERGKPRGHIRAGLPLSFGIQLVPLLAEFAADYPDISLELDFTDRRVNLVEEGLDVAVRITAQLPPTQVARQLGSCRSMVVAAPAYLAEHGEPQHPADLIRYECISYTQAFRSSWPFVVDGATQWFDVQGRITANNGEALIEAAARGLGIAYQPTFIAAQAVRAGRLRAVLTEFCARRLGIYALFPGHRHVPHRVRTLVDFLAARLAADADLASAA